MSNEPSETKQQTPLDLSQVLTKAARSGFSGSAAMAIQVGLLMWLRTTMNYQYRYGGTIKDTFKLLYSQGGVVRFYRGASVALVQGPLSRFGDTFSNTLFLNLCESYDTTRQLPITVKSIGGSVTAGLFRIILVPIDTLKTTLQVEGAQGIALLTAKIAKNGPAVMFHGAVASASATMVGHYPWFATYNILNQKLPVYTEKHKKLMRQAFIGFTSSVVSDTISNSLRVLKTTKQTNHVPLSYREALNQIIEKDGLKGLFGRGLKIRIMTNGIQGLIFSVLWKQFDDYLNSSNKNN